MVMIYDRRSGISRDGDHIGPPTSRDFAPTTPPVALGSQQITKDRGWRADSAEVACVWSSLGCHVAQLARVPRVHASFSPLTLAACSRADECSPRAAAAAQSRKQRSRLTPSGGWIPPTGPKGRCRRLQAMAEGAALLLEAQSFG